MTNGTGDLVRGPQGKPIVLKSLLNARHWGYEAFAREYRLAARRLDAKDDSSLQHKYLSTCPAQNTVRRWLRGGIAKTPHPSTCTVLEEMFPEYRADQLFQSAEPE